MRVATKPQAAHYSYVLKNDNTIVKFCVANHRGPQTVETTAPDGKTRQNWTQKEEGDLLVFYPPDGYLGGPVRWKYNKFLQNGEPMPRDLLEKLALGMRVSVSF